MTDRLGEAEVREFRQWVADATDDAIADYLARDLERIDQVAAARSWHTLTNPTDELIETVATTIERMLPTNVFDNLARVVLAALVDALTDTAEPEETGPNTSDH